MPPQDSVALMAEQSTAFPGISERLAAVRVAVAWKGQKHPEQSMVRFYWQLKSKNPRDFSATWERLEKEFEAASVPVVAPVESKVEEPLAPTETDEELREAILELLRKHAGEGKL